MEEDTSDRAFWENEIGLTKRLLISDRKNLRDMEVAPNWASFGIWLGEWAHAYRSLDSRLATLALLPASDMFAPLAALGALIDAISLPSGSLSWKSFRELPKDTPLYFIPPDQGAKTSICEGVLTATELVSEQEFVKISVVEGTKKFRDSNFFISEQTFPDYAISTTPYPSRSRRTKAARSLRFFDYILPEGDLDWTENQNAEAYVVTSLTRWKDICSSSFISAEGLNKVFSLEQVLLSDHSVNHGTSGKVAVASNRTTVHVENANLTIFDGLRAAYCWEDITTNNMLFLIPLYEWNEEAFNLLQPIFNWSQNEFVATPPDSKIPTGIELFYAELSAQ